jgi:hypothetical protein
MACVDYIMAILLKRGDRFHPKVIALMPPKGTSRTAVG